jgi:hypothetical protein
MTFLLFGCVQKTSVQNNDEFRQEEFNDFFSKFTSDSLFQLERTKFPFVIKIWVVDDEMRMKKIAKDDWKFLSFDYKEEYGTRKLDAYTQRTKIFPDSAKIELRGVDCGIYVDFLFFNEAGRWFMTSESDYSN